MRLASVCRRLHGAVFAASARPPAWLATAGLLAASALLTGCGMGPVTAASGGGSTTSMAISGRVHGGLAPVTGATIQLWETGTAGNGSAAMSLLNNTSVVTDSNGDFTITGDYSCPSPTTQVYLTSVGGNPGLSNPTANIRSLVLLSALGSCGNLSASTYIFVNEISTAAAAWALAPFFGTGATPYITLGASATNSTGLANAFLNAQLLASTPTGQPATLPSSILTESAKLITLANALASCSDSDGTTACTPLYAAATPPGGSAPTNTLAAALNIVRNPGNNVAAVYAAAGTQPPYSGGLSAAPNDWTMSVKFLGGGVVEPYGLGVDKLGNVWTVNYVNSNGGSVSAFSPQGSALGASPFGLSTLSEVTALAVDSNNDVWVASQNGSAGTLFKFGGVTSGAMGSVALSYSDGNLSGTQALALDPTLGTILAANYYDPAIVIVNLNGTLNRTLTSSYLSDGSAVISDRSGGAWAASYNTGVVVHLAGNGTSTQVACCDSPDGIAADASGNLWLANYDTTTGTTSTISEVSAAGSVVLEEVPGGGVFQPYSMAVDAGSHVWIANFNVPSGSPVRAASFSEISTGGTFLSPSTGFGLDAGMVEPRQVVPDASGTLWFADSGATNPYPNPLTPTLGRVVAILGMATPTSTPMGPVPVAP